MSRLNGNLLEFQTQTMSIKLGFKRNPWEGIRLWFIVCLWRNSGIHRWRNLILLRRIMAVSLSNWSYPGKNNLTMPSTIQKFWKFVVKLLKCIRSRKKELLMLMEDGVVTHLRICPN